MASPESVAATPRLARLLLGLAIASSFFVLVEPAPCDGLFVPAVLAALFGGQRLLPGRPGAAHCVWLFLLVLATLASLCVVKSIGDGVRFTVITLYMLGWFLCVAGFIGRGGPGAARFVLRMLCLAAVIAAAIGLLARFHVLKSPVFFKDETLLRIKSTFKDPNVFAPFLVAGLMITLALGLEEARLRWRRIAVLALLGAGILLAFSRGAWLHLGVSLLVFVGLHLLVIADGRILRRLAVIGVLVVVCCLPLLLYTLAAADLQGFLGERTGIKSYDHEERWTMQALGLHSAIQSPLGFGPGMFSPHYFPSDVHNTYLRVVTENGWLGIAAWLGFLATCMLTAWRGVRARRGDANLHACCLAIVAGICVESMVIDTLHWRHFFIVLAVPLGLSVHAQVWRKPREAEEPTLLAWIDGEAAADARAVP